MTDLRKLQDRFDCEGAHLTARRVRTPGRRHGAPERSDGANISTPGGHSAAGGRLEIRRYRVFRVEREMEPIDVRTDLRWGWLALSAAATLAILFAAVTP